MSEPGESIVWDFEKLHGSSNWKQWSRNLEMAFLYEGWTDILTESVPLQPEEVEAKGSDGTSTVIRDITGKELEPYKEAYDSWSTRNSKGTALMYFLCDKSIRDTIAHCGVVKEAYEILQKRYDDCGFTAKHQAARELLRITLGSCNNDVETYVQKMRHAWQNLDLLDCGFPEWWIVSCFITNLDGRFQDFSHRTVIRKELPIFDDVAAELLKIDRIYRREKEAETYRT